MLQRTLQLLTVILVTLAGLAPPSLAACQRDEEQRRAPDGHRGFGSEVELGDLLKRFRTPSEEDEEFIEELESLARDVGVLVDITEGYYRDRGYFELLDPVDDQSLEMLHEVYARYEHDPSVVVNRPKRIGRAFARLFLDSRFRVRRHLVGGWARAAEELVHGLAVLRAAAHGYVILDGEQASNVVMRLDLAAAVMRSTRSDLDSLREPLDAAKDTVDTDAEADAFLAMFNISDRDQREQALAELYRREETSEQRMRSVLFTERLAEQAHDRFEWRDRADAEASELLARALEAVPDGEQREDIPREVARLSKSKRRKLAREKALEGLGFDPLDAELAWTAGLMSSFVFGELETASHFDRFLVLHGISYRDEASYGNRELSERERIALKYVQEIDRRVQGVGGD